MKTRKKIILNFITDALPIGIIGILGIFKLRLFLETLGNETLGLYQLFIQIMFYVALVDGGLATAVLYSLYKPNSTNNNKKLAEILTGAYKAFKKIGATVFFIAATIGFIIPFLIKNNSFPYLYIALAFMIFSLSNVVEYFFVPYRSLLEVKEKKYVNNISLQLGQILQSCIEICMLLLHCKFISILIMHGIIKLLANIAIAIICKKMYPDISFKEKEMDTSFTFQIKHLIFHKINGLVGSNIDVVLISKFLGLKSVAIYSAYRYIINTLSNVFNKISSAILAIIGNIIVKSKEKVYELFLEFHSFIFLIATVVCVPLTYALNSFIQLWYKGKIETSIYISIAFTLCMFSYIIRQPISTFVTADGLFKETKKCALADTIINLILSFVLLYFIGIPGVLIATAISVFISEYILKNKVIHQELFKQKIRYFYYKSIKYFLILFIDFGLFYLIINNIVFNSLSFWFLFYIIYTVINGFIIFIIYYLLGDTKFIARLKGGNNEEKNINISVKR